MKHGFALKRLALRGGDGKEFAEVTFERGLNVIAGPSDTGKSYIMQCLDYVLGAGTPPKEIPEATGYNTVVLEIEANSDSQIFTLERGLRGGEVLLKTAGQPDRVLNAKHQAGNEETVSQFLLNLSGLGTKKLRTNAQGKTRPLSFRDISPLVLIDEESVIKAESPILTGQVISKTIESGVFRLLLTGTDDSSIIANEDPKIAKGRQAGRIELLEGLLAQSRGRLSEFGETSTLAQENERLQQVEAAIQAAAVERSAAQMNAAPLETRRHAAWIELRSVDSKLAVLTELQTRFDLLHEQYASDLRRLETIAEAGVRLGQLREERCPVCGSVAEHHDEAHRQAAAAPADVFQACKAEVVKTSQLMRDLQTTRTANAAEVEQLQADRKERQRALTEVSAELKALMEQQVDVASKQLDDLRARAETARKAIEVLERVQELEELLADATKPKKKPKADVAGAAVSTAQADPFSRHVEALLKAWHYPSLDRVTFSENDQDVVISSRPRKSHGKGVRAITRAAFNLALLELCVEDERPFPNFVVIDSPLLVYEEPDADESSFPQDVKRAFWESVKTSFTDAQVVIIENREQLPDDATLDGVNVVTFSGNDQGRRGFIPRPRSTS